MKKWRSRRFYLLMWLYAKRFILRNFFAENESIHTKALSIAFGVFMGISPFIGFQLIIGIPLAHLMKLNKAIFIAASYISLPPLIPFLIFISYELGGWILGGSAATYTFDASFDIDMIQSNYLQYAIGAIVLASVLAIAAGALAYLLLIVMNKNRMKVKSIGDD